MRPDQLVVLLEAPTVRAAWGSQIRSGSPWRVGNAIMRLIILAGVLVWQGVAVREGNGLEY